MAPAARADEAAIVAALRQAFATPNQIPALAAQIVADPAYDRARLAAWLDRSAPYPALTAGRHDLVVDVGLGQQRRVTLRLPRGYASARAWPLIYALHPSGGDGPAFIGYLEHLLGDDVEGFIVAAPSGYRQTGVDAPPPFTLDHPRILRAVRQQAHVDAGRTYAVGYSLGGYAAWAVALLHADLVASAVPLAATFTVPADAPDGLWRLFVDNFRHLGKVWMVWGADDRQPVYGFRDDHLGGIATINRQYRAWTTDLGLPQALTEQPRRGHGEVIPDKRELLRVLSGRRERWPTAVDHAFRHLHQGSAYWLEATSWAGERWGEQPPVVAPRPGEAWGSAFARVVGALLGELHGAIDGQTLRIHTAHVGDLDVWLGDGMVDWQRPIRVERDGRTAFEGEVRPDLATALGEAVGSYDFDRLRWARIRLQQLTAPAKDSDP
jgi:pimeloyl-ACP methyl ester carboxylesterase